MEQATHYLKNLLQAKGVFIEDKHASLLSKFCGTNEIKDSIDSITLIQDKMINAWKRNVRISDFIDTMITIPNATVGKLYTHVFDVENESFKGIIITGVFSEDLDIIYDLDSNTITSTFNNAGQFKIEIKFKLEGASNDEEVGTKEVKLLVNPDPKSLWKNLDSNREDPYWKEDNASSSGILGSKKFIVGSKRGRSHAHEGIFRDDDFAFDFSTETGWGIMAVADGAGSAKYSRKGSILACERVVQYFKNIEVVELTNLCEAINAEISESNESNQKLISSFCITHLGKAAFSALNVIKEEAILKGAHIKDYSTTLIFSFVKEFGDKMFVSSFWVGDGGIGIYSKEPNFVSLLGVPDSGEFSGQTRFLTMNEIFADNDYIKRIKYKIVDKNCKLILMTDGITDAKFQTDSALEKIDVWNSFMDDLDGKNEENKKIDFDTEIELSEESLMNWMDFWSAGNHDDRTLAIFY